jgi:hypothetical protein
MAATRYIVTKGYDSEWRGERVHVQAGALLPANSPHLRGHAEHLMAADTAEQIALARERFPDLATPADFDPGEHSVDEVRQHLLDHPEDEGRVLRLESDGRARKTLVGGDVDGDAQEG